MLLFGAANTPGSHDERRAGEYAVVVGTIKPDDTTEYFENGGQVYAANYGAAAALPNDRVHRYHATNQPAEGIATGFV